MRVQEAFFPDGPDRVTAFYNMACLYALQGKVEGVLGPLRRALELDREHFLRVVADDEDFDLVRGDARFRALLEEFFGGADAGDG